MSEPAFRVDGLTVPRSSFYAVACDPRQSVVDRGLRRIGQDLDAGRAHPARLARRHRCRRSARHHFHPRCCRRDARTARAVARAMGDATVDTRRACPGVDRTGAGHRGSGTPRTGVGQLARAPARRRPPRQDPHLPRLVRPAAAVGPAGDARRARHAARHGAGRGSGGASSGGDARVPGSGAARPATRRRLPGSLGIARPQPARQVARHRLAPSHRHRARPMPPARWKTAS